MKQKSLILMSTLLVCSLESFAQSDVEKNDSIWKDFDLASVTVVASKPLVKMETDKMTYNVQQDADAKASTVLDMLRKVPMVTVDGQDNITVNGSSSFKVYVDGKPNPMFSANPSQIFKAMPATMVKNIEVITNPGAKYDAEGTGGVLNIVLDPVFIFAFGLGVRGAAIATVIGQFCGMFLGFILNQTRNHELHLTLRPFFRPHGAVLTDILAVGIPSVVMQAISSVMNVLMNMILLGFGNVAVNVLGAYFKLQSFVFMPVFGLSNGLVAIVGYNYGAHLRERVYAAVRVALRMAIVIMAVGMLLFMTIPQVLLSLFEAEGAGDLTAVGCPALRVISLSFILAAVGITLGTVFQAVGKGVYSLINSLCRQLMVLLPAAWLLSRLGDLSAVWWSFPIAEVVSLAVCLLLYRRVDRTMLKTL